MTKIMLIALTTFVSFQAFAFEKPDQLILLETEVTIAKVYRDNVDATLGAQILSKKQQEIVEYSNFVRNFDSATTNLPVTGQANNQDLKSELEALNTFALETGRAIKKRKARIFQSIEALVEFKENGNTTFVQRYVEQYLK